MESRRIIVSLFSVMALTLPITSSNLVQAGNLVQNGDFSSYNQGGSIIPNHHYLAQIGNVNPPNGSLSGKGTLTGWTIYQGTHTDNTNVTAAYAYLFNTANQTYLVSPADAPPNGSNFLSIIGDTYPNYSVNSIQQTIGGLTIGTTYSVSFDWAASAYTGYIPNNIGWDVSLGGGTAQEVTVTNNSSGKTTAWMHQTFNFKATSTSEVLEFLAVAPVHSGPPVALITNIDMEAVAVPEPSTLVSLGLGSIAFVGVGLRRRSRALKSTSAT